MSYLFLFIPAIGWGLMPMFVAGVKKSNIYHQILGTVIGAFIFGAAVTLIKRSSFNATTFILAMLAGAAWVIGQVGQYSQKLLIQLFHKDLSEWINPYFLCFLLVLRVYMI